MDKPTPPQELEPPVRVLSRTDRRRPGDYFSLFARGAEKHGGAVSSIPVPGLPPGFEVRSSGVLESWRIPWVLLRDNLSGAGIMHVSTDVSDHFMGI